VTRIIALDHGTRRIGVAVGDMETGMAFARPALLRRNLVTDLAAIGRLVAADAVQMIVVGLPLNMDGTEGEQAADARRFGEQVAQSGIGVVYEDERLSSWEAGERLSEAGRRPRRERGELDSAAARVILQQYLDTRRRTAAPEETE
jgi:putative Holliday junction resolvase